MNARSLALGVALVGLFSTGCSEDKARAPTAPGCSDPSCVNPIPIGGATDASAGSDGAVSDSARDGAIGTSDASTTVTGVVRPLSKFTVDPSSVAEISRTITVRAPKIGGGVTPDATPGLDGTFTLSDVAANVGGPTWLQVLFGGNLKAIDAVGLPQTGLFQLPLFDENLPQTTWVALGIATTYPTTPPPATIVVQVFDAKGARKAGVTATTFGDAKGPFYDDGSDVAASAKATGARGTILFLGQTAASGPFNLTLSDGAKAYATIAVPLGSGATSYLALTLD